MPKYPLYSVIDDEIEVGTVGSDQDAQDLCGGYSVVFVNEKRPLNVPKLDNDEVIEDFGYFVKIESEDFIKQNYFSL